MYFFRNGKGNPCYNTEVYSSIPYVSIVVHVFMNELCTKVEACLYHDTIRLNGVQQPPPQPTEIFFEVPLPNQRYRLHVSWGYSIYHFRGGKITFKLRSNINHSIKPVLQ
jgi:hypothetical protein